ncbi:hypothetical protein B0H17DRAFT_79172 [Mycena rosella]|uniref:Uncharacterized protein n=1 Tax=Mycena rosella TaxID=1033263 RepID=A0AAD7GDJ1_MYCRO|nr:hypothetical protein B0H17DRAFT_79172 [Mycena rosella]
MAFILIPRRAGGALRRAPYGARGQGLGEGRRDVVWPVRGCGRREVCIRLFILLLSCHASYITLVSLPFRTFSARYFVYTPHCIFPPTLPASPSSPPLPSPSPFFLAFSPRSPPSLPFHSSYILPFMLILARPCSDPYLFLHAPPILSPPSLPSPPSPFLPTSRTCPSSSSPAREDDVMGAYSSIPSTSSNSLTITPRIRALIPPPPCAFSPSSPSLASFDGASLLVGKRRLYLCRRLHIQFLPSCMHTPPHPHPPSPTPPSSR